MREGARNQLGSRGEQLAAEFLVGLGYVLLAQNLTLKQGEIDLLMQDGETIVVVEVKTQTRFGRFDPVYKLNLTKRRKLLLLAQIVAARYPERNIRIDAVTLYWEQGRAAPTINHYQNISE